MKRRIYHNFIFLLLLFALMQTLCAGLLFSGAIKNAEIASIKNSAVTLADFLNSGARNNGGAYTDYISGGAGGLRLTVISPAGTVLLDSRTAALSLENHADREEVAEAFKAGFGEAIRFSSTLSDRTYYYAIRLDDGNVLRVSKTMSNIGKSFSPIILAFSALTLFMLLAANFASRGLAGNILRPVIELTPDPDSIAADNSGPIYEELVPLVKKINRQRRDNAAQLEALRERADTIDIITANMKEGLILLNKNGSVLSANRSAAEIFGEPEMTGKNILYVYRDAAFQKGVKACLSGGAFEISRERNGRMYSVYFNPVYDIESDGGAYDITNDGARSVVNFDARNAANGGANEGGSVNGAIILFFDITERYIAERQRREFTANVSHELKTPLTAISALAELIENGMAAEGDAKAFAAKIGVQAGRLINIIDDIIKLSELDERASETVLTGGGAVNAESGAAFSLFECALSVRAALFEKADQKRVTVGVTGECFDVNADRRMIDDLFFNLIDNAIKYNAYDGRVAVELSRDGGMCKITVSDTGVGIAEEHHDRVFERFYRVDKSRSKAIEGTGLGLSIVKHIVALYRGRIELESAEGAGASITCWLDIL